MLSLLIEWQSWWSALLKKAVTTQRKIDFWFTPCYSPTSSSERKDFVANTPHKAWACKAVGKGFKIRQWSFQACASNVPKAFRSKGERWYIHRTTDSTNAWLQGIRRQNDCFRKRCLAVISQCCAWFSRKKQNTIIQIITKISWKL